MLWYNILNPRAWPGVNIKTGNNKIDGVYYNLLSSNHVSLAASGSMFLAANNGIQLISPSFVQASGLKITNVLAENFGKINSLGNIIPLYPGESGSVIFKKTDSDLIGSNLLKYDEEKNILMFPGGSPGSPMYISPSGIGDDGILNSDRRILTFEDLKFSPQISIAVEEETEEETEEGEENRLILEESRIDISCYVAAHSGINLGPNNNLNSYKGYILTHDGSGEVAKWKPTEFLKENYDDDYNEFRNPKDDPSKQMPFEGLERVGTSLIRFPKRPALLYRGKLHFYRTTPSWSPTRAFGTAGTEVLPPIEASIEELKKELGTGEDTLCIQTVKGELKIAYAKFGFVERATAEQFLKASFINIDERIEETAIIDPDSEGQRVNVLDESGNIVGTTIEKTPVPGISLDIAPKNPGGLDDEFEGEGINVYVFSVTKGSYLPIQIEPKASGYIVDELPIVDENAPPPVVGPDTPGILRQEILFDDDGTLLEEPLVVPFRFKPNTSNNISTRPNIHTCFNMLGENIDFLIYGKEYTHLNNYDEKFELNEHFIPTGTIPVFKIDANIFNSVIGSPTGVIYTKFIDREKTQPIGWKFDHSGKVCIKTHDSYVLDSIPSGVSGLLQSHADLTINGHTYTTSLIAEDIYLKPIPNAENTGKYIRNALLTVDNFGKIVSRVPSMQPTLPGVPKNIMGTQHNFQYSIRWMPPDNNKEFKIVNYIIQTSINNGDIWIDLPSTNPLISVSRGFDQQISATVDFSNFQIPNPVIFRVAAQNEVGIGEYSESTETSFVSNTGVPFRPLNFQAERTDEETSIILSWEATNFWGSATASGYIIQESSNENQTDWFSVAFIPYNEELSYEDTGLDLNNSYLYRIYAINSVSGTSAYTYVHSSNLLDNRNREEEEERRREDILSNFDFNNILFTGICNLS